MDKRSGHPRSRIAGVIVCLAATVTCITGGGQHVATADGGLIARGKAIVVANCIRCHAGGRSDVSPLPAAPPLRTISSKYPLTHLAEAFAEGIVTAHPAMPQFILPPADIDALLAYVASISPRDTAK